MNTFEALYSRRSIRSYNGENLTENELKEILKSAYAAPVGRARYDTLALTVVSNKDVLAKWEEEAAKAFGNPGMHPFYGAPTVIIVSSVDPSEMSNVRYSNAAIIVQNMAIAAAELGVGACHIWGAIPALCGSEELKKALSIPETMVPCCALALGHTTEKYTPRQVENDRIVTNFVK